MLKHLQDERGPLRHGQPPPANFDKMTYGAFADATGKFFVDDCAAFPVAVSSDGCLHLAKNSYKVDAPRLLLTSCS